MAIESPFPPFDPGKPDAEDDKVRRRIPFRHIVPNLITILAICAGMTGIRLAFEGRFESLLDAWGLEEAPPSIPMS